MIPLNTRHRVLVSACLAFLLALAPAASAYASTLSDKRAQAVAVQSKVDALITKQEIASEQYNAARDRYDAVSSQVDASRRRLAKLRSEMDSLQAALGTQADAMYRDNETLGFLEALMSARTLEDFNSTLELVQRVGEQNAATAASLKTTQAAVVVEQQRLLNAQTDAAAQQSVMAANAKIVNARLADQRKLLASISADIKKILAARAAAAAAAAAKAEHDAGIDTGGNPPTSSKGAAAVWWAEKALGRPYQWAATGPSTFDCSGLMKWAYAHVGIDLPHYSGAQINVGARVARANLEPGDLVFFGSPIHHVGMYIGGGRFIEAPYTGANVRISDLNGRGDYAGACRPS